MCLFVEPEKKSIQIFSKVFITLPFNPKKKKPAKKPKKRVMNKLKYH